MEDAEGMTAQVRAMMARERRSDYLKMERGSNWFVYVAGMTGINTLLALAGVGWHFIIGLGMTQLLDEVARLTAESLPGLLGLLPRGLALGADTALMVGLVALARRARRRHAWAFVVGMAAYAIDGLLFGLLGDWLGAASHLLPLAYLYSGLEGLRHLRDAAPLDG